MAEAIAIDSDWLSDHPLPLPPEDTDKNARGQVLVAGGCLAVPGGLLLTGEAALRAGAGKVRLATVRSLAVPLGVAFPEAGLIALPEDGEDEVGDVEAPQFLRPLAQCDCAIVGPAMKGKAAAARVLAAALDRPREGMTLVIDAAAIAGAGEARDRISNHRGRVIITPNPGEAASLLEIELDAVVRDPEGSARRVVDLTGAVVTVKGPNTVVATPDGDLLRYSGGGVGLATGGSGDVQTGILGGLLALGVAPCDAATWAVWIHGEAGRRLAEQVGPIGYLARELLPLIPRLMRAG